MGMNTFPARMLGKIPTYYITDVLQEDAGGGNVRVWGYTRKSGVLVPQYEVIMASQNLLVAGRKIVDFAQHALSTAEMRLDGKVH